MTTGALLFMVLSWSFVLGLTGWAFGKILRLQKHFDPDGIGPASAAHAPPRSADTRGSARVPGPVRLPVCLCFAETPGAGLTDRGPLTLFHRESQP